MELDHALIFKPDNRAVSSGCILYRVNFDEVPSAQARRFASTKSIRRIAPNPLFSLSIIIRNQKTYDPLHRATSVFSENDEWMEKTLTFSLIIRKKEEYS